MKKVAGQARHDNLFTEGERGDSGSKAGMARVVKSAKNTLLSVVLSAAGLRIIQ